MDPHGIWCYSRDSGLTVQGTELRVAGMLDGNLGLLVRRDEGEGGSDGGEVIEFCVGALGEGDGAVI